MLCRMPIRSSLDQSQQLVPVTDDACHALAFRGKVNLVQGFELQAQAAVVQAPSRSQDRRAPSVELPTATTRPSISSRLAVEFTALFRAIQSSVCPPGPGG